MSAAAILWRAVLAAAAAMGMGAAPASACSCRCETDAAALVRETPLLFRGRPTAETVVGEERRYTFDVVAVHKGDIAARVTVSTSLYGAACGVTYSIGREVLVGAYPGKDGLSVNRCTQVCVDRHREAIEPLPAR